MEPAWSKTSSSAEAESRKALFSFARPWHQMQSQQSNDYELDDVIW